LGMRYDGSYIIAYPFDTVGEIMLQGKLSPSSDIQRIYITSAGRMITVGFGKFNTNECIGSIAWKVCRCATSHLGAG
jgi:hypothetical protein